MQKCVRVCVFGLGLVASGVACSDPKADGYTRDSARHGGPLGGKAANPGALADYSNYAPAPFDPISGPAEPVAIEKPDAGQSASPPSADPAVNAAAGAFDAVIREVEQKLGAGDIEAVLALVQPDQVAAITPEKRAFLAPTFEKWSLVRKTAAAKLGEGGDAKLDQLLSGRPNGGFAITPVNTETATVSPNPLAWALGGGDPVTIVKKDGTAQVQLQKPIDDAALAAAAERHAKIQAALDALLAMQAEWESLSPDDLLKRLQTVLSGG